MVEAKETLKKLLEVGEFKIFEGELPKEIIDEALEIYNDILLEPTLGKEYKVTDPKGEVQITLFSYFAQKIIKDYVVGKEMYRGERDIMVNAAESDDYNRTVDYNFVICVNYDILVNYKMPHLNMINEGVVNFLNRRYYSKLNDLVLYDEEKDEDFIDTLTRIFVI